MDSMVYYTWMKLVSNAKNVVLRAEIFLKKLLLNMQGVTEMTAKCNVSVREC